MTHKVFEYLPPRFYSQAHQLLCSHRQKPWSFELFRQSVERNLVFCIHEEDELYGYVIVNKGIDIADIEDIATASKHWRKGVAHALLSAAIERLYVCKCSALMLEVSEQNTAAITLYEKLGFQQIDERKNYYLESNGTTRNALIMRLSLD